MAVGISGDELMIRVGADATDDAFARPTPSCSTRRSAARLKILVAADGLRSAAGLDDWVAGGVAFARSRPPMVPVDATLPW